MTLARTTALSQTFGIAIEPSRLVPLNFADQTDINLDEHVLNNAPGVNDTVVFVAATQNAGPNDALGVTVTIPVPKDMLVLSVPANCVLLAQGKTTVGPTMANAAGFAGIQSGSGATMTCTPPKTIVPQPSALAPPTYVSQISSCLGATTTCPASIPLTVPLTVNSAFAWSAGTYPYATVPAALAVNGGPAYVVTFAAKYVDTGLGTDTVAGLASTGVESFTAATAGGADVDAANIAATAPGGMTVQRAAHVSLSSATLPSPTYTDGSAIPLNGGLLEIGQAALGMQYTTGIANASKIYNCERFSVPVVNLGPNYAVGAQLTYAIDRDKFVPTQTTNLANADLSSPSPLNCNGTAGAALPGVAAGAAQTAALGNLGFAAAASAGDAYLDGYFDLGALGAANSATATFSTQKIAGGYMDSNTPGTVKKDFATTETETLVNTPFNTFGTAVGQSFSVTPAPVNPAAPVVTLAFSTVAAPGGTTTASTAAGVALPTGFASGASPYPPDKQTVRPLYQAGTKTPYTYGATTTAAVGATGFCVNEAVATGLPDVFVKPERVLLWALPGAPAGTVFNSIPIFAAGAATYTPTNLTGDITSNVTPSGDSAYVMLPKTLAFPQAPQAQPGRICGLLGGLPSPATQATTPLMVAVLEPVNFAPYVVGSINASSQPAKGSTLAQATVTLTVGTFSSGSPTTHDFNDGDPCYTTDKLSPAGTPGRNTCDDNPYLNAFLYGGNNIVGGAQVSPAIPVLATGGTQALESSFNLAGGAEVYIAVIDQATGADALNPNITGFNPFYKQGNFLLTGATGCDPGTAIPGVYLPTGSSCLGETGSLNTSGDMFFVDGGTGYLAGPAYSYGNVGIEGFIETGASGSGLIPLPFPAAYPTSSPGLVVNPGTTSSLPLGVAATATVTPGQTAAFVWPWLSTITQSITAPGHGALAGSVYTLQCFSTDASQAPLTSPTEVPCNISAVDQAGTTSSTYTFGSSAAPTIFIVTSGNEFSQVRSPAWLRLGGGVAFGVLAPFLFLRRRRPGKLAALLTLLFSVAAVQMLTGCGSSTSAGTASMATAPGTYYFRVVATPTTNACPAPQTTTEEMTCEAPIYSAVFEVVVQSAN